MLLQRREGYYRRYIHNVTNFGKKEGNLIRQHLLFLLILKNHVVTEPRKIISNFKEGMHTNATFESNTESI